MVMITHNSRYPIGNIERQGNKPGMMYGSAMKYNLKFPKAKIFVVVIVAILSNVIST